MNTSQIDKIVSAVLYEGYSLYPYRQCIKNARRWLFGCVYPARHPSVIGGAESARMTTRCLLEGGRATRLSVQVRFLHLLDRDVAYADDGGFTDVIEIDGGSYASCQEAVERRIDVGTFSLEEAMAAAKVKEFSFPATDESEIIASHTGGPNGLIRRRQYPLQGAITCVAHLYDEGLFGLDVAIENRSPLAAPPQTAGLVAQAPFQALVSTHTILAAEEGHFISLIDPPEHCRAIAAGLKNDGAWPVLVGAEGQRDTMLSSPIILYDYPQVAAESSGDLFDATEIDEILALRILTLSDDEKRQLRSGDQRTRQILERTESLGDEHFRKLHGAIRGLQPLAPAGS